MCDSGHDRYSRRRAFGTLGAVGLGTLLAACGADDEPTRRATVPTVDGTPSTVAPQTTTDGAAASRFDGAASCRVTAEQTEGPFYFDVDAIRSDIREDREGVELRLAFRVREAEGCAPLGNAVVDVWHCDASGLYSGFESPSGGGRSGEETYLRGAQVTDRDGIAQFVTVFPGSYPGRAPHVHFKVHLDRTTVLTSQLYFDEAASARVFEQPPYADAGDRGTSNEDDGLFDGSLVATTEDDGDGLLALMTVDVARA